MDDHRFNVLVRLGTDPIACEGDVTRGQNRRLRIVDVGIFDKRQVARTTGDGDEDFVLNTACRRALPDSQVSAAGVGIERNKDQVGALIGRDTSQFRKLTVVTNLDRHFAAIGIKDAKFIPRFDAPPTLFGRRDVQLVLLVNLAVAMLFTRQYSLRASYQRRDHRMARYSGSTMISIPRNTSPRRHRQIGEAIFRG